MKSNVNMIFQIADITHAVTFPKVSLTVQTLEGVVACAAGDAVITGTQGESWPAQRDAFFHSYSPMPGVVAGEDGQYKKRLAFVEARQLRRMETI